MRTFFTPSMAVACLALAVALSGTAYAVARLPANSVGTKQVINHSLQRVDFGPGALVRGPRGARGAVGPAGPTGPAGTGGISLNALTERSKSLPISPTAGVDTTVTTDCPAGTTAFKGGYVASTPVYVLSDYSLGTTWAVQVRSAGVEGLISVYTYCVAAS